MELPEDKRLWNFYRLGPTKEKEFFKRNRDSYTGIVIPAHIASYYSKFCSEFIGAIRKPYFIDPITYLFARNTTILKRYLKDKKTGRTIKDLSGNKLKGDIKRSYKKLVEEVYKGIIETTLKKNKSLEPNDFKKDKVVDEFTENVINFQKKAISELPEKYKKYLKYVPITNSGPAVEKNFPSLLIPPYFYVESFDKDGWYYLNLKFVEMSISKSDGIPVYPIIFMDIELLSKNADKIINDYSRLKTNGIILWINNFNGYGAKNTLNEAINFVHKLNSVGKPIISLYGDAFSLLLNWFGLKGFSSAICYGESKGVDQDIDVEGQIPPRYYIKKLKKKIQIDEARRVELPKYTDLNCNCLICQIKENPADQDDIETKEHFLKVRAEELTEISNMNKEEFLAELISIYDTYKDNIVLGPIGYLKNWIELLSVEIE